MGNDENETVDPDPNETPTSDPESEPPVFPGYRIEKGESPDDRECLQNG